MQSKKQFDVAEPVAVEETEHKDHLRPLIENRPIGSYGPTVPGVVIGELVAMIDDGRTPLVAVPGRTAVRARTTVDIHGVHVGCRVALVFENGDPVLPLIIGILQNEAHTAVAAWPGTVDVEADDQQLVVSAAQRLVLRCGKARITLTRAGKVLIEGTYISSRSSGVNRIRGGSVHLN